MKRRDLIAILAGAAVARPIAVRAQQKKMPVVGWLHTLSADRSAPVINAFREGLREAGYIEGENIAIEAQGFSGSTHNRPPSRGGGAHQIPAI